jgi:hypothetical protein
MFGFIFCKPTEERGMNSDLGKSFKLPIGKSHLLDKQVNYLDQKWCMFLWEAKSKTNKHKNRTQLVIREFFYKIKKFKSCWMF